MRYFSKSEFLRRDINWYYYLSEELKEGMDLFREYWGSPVDISKSKFSLGRNNGPDGTSQHNVDRDGVLRAVDLMPRGLYTREDMERAIECAHKAGATGIGVYPQWRVWSPMGLKKRPGVHIDYRVDRTASNPALWGAVRDNGLKSPQRYTSQLEALEKMK